MSRYAFVSTDVLDIAYLEWNPQGGRAAPSCCTVGRTARMPGKTWRSPWRTPAIGCWHQPSGDSPRPASAMRLPRSGQLAALACDLLAFVDGLALQQRPLLVGHTGVPARWPVLAGLREGFASHLVMLSVG